MLFLHAVAGAYKRTASLPFKCGWLGVGGPQLYETSQRDGRTGPQHGSQVQVKVQVFKTFYSLSAYEIKNRGYTILPLHSFLVFSNFNLLFPLVLLLTSCLHNYRPTLI